MKKKMFLMLLLAVAILFTACGQAPSGEPAVDGTTNKNDDSQISEPLEPPAAGQSEQPEQPTAEQPEAPAAVDAAVYSQILEAYGVAYENQYFGGDLEKCGDINPEILSANAPLVYALVDLSGDSSPELFLAADTGEGFLIYDIWSYADGRTQRLFEPYSMGYRMIYTICENNCLRMAGSNGAANQIDVFYTLPALSAVPVMLETVECNSLSEPAVYTRTAADGSLSTLSEAEYNSLLASYGESGAVEWQELN